MEPTQPSAWEHLVRSLIGFPKYILEWTLGLIVAVLTDLHITTLAVTGAISGLYFGDVTLGFLLFFFLYTASRVASMVANSIGIGSQEIGQSNRQVAGAIHSVVQQVQTNAQETNGE